MNAKFLLLATALALVVLFVFLISLRWWVQRLVRIILSCRYRLIILGREHIPRKGPVLIACNHVSWLDGFFLAGPARAGARRW